MDIYGINCYETSLLELERYCQRKYPLLTIKEEDISFRMRCAEIWAYEEAIKKCKEQFYINPENILLDFAMYLSVSSTKEQNYEAKCCFSKAYLVIETMLNFLQKI